jgi:hypothetical protein
MSRIRAGIVDGHPGWELLLSQEGVPFSHREEKSFFDDCSLLVAGDMTSGRDVEQIKNFLRKGKALLCTGSVAELLTGAQCRRRLLKSVLAAPGSLFDGAGLVDLYTNGRIYPGAGELLDERNHPTTYHGELHGGYLVVLPFDPACAIADSRTIAKSYYAARRRLPYEHVPLVSKQEVRKIVARALEILHRKIGLPYVHRWYYPGRSSSVAALRIDTDFAAESDLRGLSDLSSALAIPFSWFIDVESQIPHLDVYRSMRNQEIGLHCFRHRRYKNAAVAAGDIGEGAKILRERGFAIGGCALPYGQWSAEFGKVIEQYGFRYSSEFAYDVDNLPSYPDLGYHRSGVLQIPVHPISIGNLRRQGFPEQEMAEYFESVVRMKISRREPALMYHHPKNQGRNVLEAMFSALRRESATIMTMAEYAAWWADRTDDLLTLDAQADRLLITGRTGRSDAMLRIVNGEGKEAFVPPSETTMLASLTWAASPVPDRLPDDCRRARKYNPWVAIQKAEDVVTALFRSK